MSQVYDVVELDQMAEGDQIQSALKEITGIRTVMYRSLTIHLANINFTFKYN